MAGAARPPRRGERDDPRTARRLRGCRHGPPGRDLPRRGGEGRPGRPHRRAHRRRRLPVGDRKRQDGDGHLWPHRGPRRRPRRPVPPLRRARRRQGRLAAGLRHRLARRHRLCRRPRHGAQDRPDRGARHGRPPDACDMGRVLPGPGRHRHRQDRAGRARQAHRHRRRHRRFGLGRVPGGHRSEPAGSQGPGARPRHRPPQLRGR